MRSTCAINDDHSITCWGRPSPIPVEEMSDKDYDQISMGQDHLCAIDMDSQLRCWRWVGADMGGHKVPLGFLVA